MCNKIYLAEWYTASVHFPFNAKEGKNKVQLQDRVTLISKVKTLVYAKSELSLLKKYEYFIVVT